MKLLPLESWSDAASAAAATTSASAAADLELVVAEAGKSDDLLCSELELPNEHPSSP